MKRIWTMKTTTNQQPNGNRTSEHAQYSSNLRLSERARYSSSPKARRKDWIKLLILVLFLQRADEDRQLDSDDVVFWSDIQVGSPKLRKRPHRSKKKGRTRLNTTSSSQEKTMTNQWLKTKVLNKRHSLTMTRTTPVMQTAANRKPQLHKPSSDSASSRAASPRQKRTPQMQSQLSIRRPPRILPSQLLLWKKTKLLINWLWAVLNSKI